MDITIMVVSTELKEDIARKWFQPACGTPVKVVRSYTEAIECFERFSVQFVFTEINVPLGIPIKEARENTPHILKCVAKKELGLMICEEAAKRRISCYPLCLWGDQHNPKRMWSNGNSMSMYIAR